MGVTVVFASSSGGIDSYSVTSPQNATGGAGAQTMRVLAPTAAYANYPHAFLWMLPAEPGQGSAFGDPLAVMQGLDAHDAYNVTCVQPGFPVDPWYADNPLDPATMQETFILYLARWVTANLAVTGTEKHYLIGFSKSGIGGQGLIFRSPSLFAGCASWDAPFMMTDYDGTDPTNGGTVGGNSAAVYGTSASFTSSYQLSPAHLAAWKAAGGFGAANRIWTGGWSAFAADVAAYQALLASAGIMSTATWSVNETHAWHPDWVAAALPAILPGLPPARRTGTRGRMASRTAEAYRSSR